MSRARHGWRRGWPPELEEARAALPELEDLTRIGGTRPLRAAAALAGGMVATAGGAHEHARRLLEDAVDAFERSGAPFDAARARIELAVCLIARSSRRWRRRG